MRKKKILRVEVEEIPIITYTYNYVYTDNAEVTVRVEGIESLDDVEKDLNRKIKKLSNERYKIKLVKREEKD